MLLVAICLVAYAGTRPAAAPGWLVDTWTSEDGLPLDHANGVAVGQDGGVLIATFDGLVRFDGARFDPVRAPEMGRLRTNRIAALEVHPDDGALWLLGDSSRAVARWYAGGLEVWDQEAGFPAAPRMLSQDEGGLWLSTDLGLYSLGERPERWRGDLIGGETVGTVLSPDGTRWVGLAEGEVWRFPRTGLPERLGEADGVPERVYFLVGGPSGEPVLVTQDDTCLLRWDGERFAASCESEQRLLGREHMLTDEPVPLEQGWGLSVHGVTYEGALVEPWVGRVLAAEVLPDGSLWLATTSAGVMRIRRSPLKVVRSGAVDEQVNALHVDAEGRLWLRGWSDWWTAGSAGPAPLLPPDARFDLMRLDYVLQLEGETTFVGSEGLVAWDSDSERSQPLGGPPFGWVLASHRSPSGELIVADADRLYVRRADVWSEQTDQDGHPIPMVRDIEDHPAGGLLLATFGQGLLHLSPAGELSRLTDPSGQNTANIRDVRTDGPWLWVASEDSGLCAVPWATPTAAWRCVGQETGLPAPGAHLSVVDPRGRVWVSTNRGLGVAPEEALRAFARGERDAVHLLRLDTRAGMASSEANGGNDLCAARTPDGMLWFASQRGAVGVDPEMFELPGPPELRALRASAGGKPLAQVGAHLPSGHPPLELAWRIGESPWADQVRFRVRLGEGPWSPPSEEPAATLARLPPGPFTVEVQAGIAGQWGPSASWSATRTPSLTERPAFPVGLAALAGLGVLGWALGRERRRRVHEQALEAQVRARTAQLAESNAALAQRTEQLGESNAALAEQAEVLAAQAERLRELDDLRSRMIVNLHHELRTPISLVLGPLDALRGAEGLSPQLVEALDLACRSAESLEVLLGQLFDIARLEACELPVRAAYIELGALARRVVGRLEPFARDRQVVMEVIEGPPMPAWCDPELLDKALGNLVHNAIKFSPPGGRVEVAGQRDEDWLRLEVRDEGPGVPDADRQRVFERLYQVDRSDSRRRGGSGIGLALAKEVVELHGGRIDVTPRVRGGSVFAIHLLADEGPLSTVELGLKPSTSELTPSLPRAASPPGAPRVLVVDDHPDMRAFLHAQLAESYAVEVAGDGEEALRVAKERPPAVVVSDVMMPGMTGLELVRRLGELFEAGAPRVLLLSAKSSVEDRVAGLEVADDYLTKPFRVAELKARVRRLVGVGPSPSSPIAAGPPSPSLDSEGSDPPAERLPEADRRLLERVEAATLARLHEADFRVTELAAAVAMSPRNFRRELRRLTDSSPSEWLLERRLRRARELLETGSYHTVGEIAAAVGLSRSYFSRAYSSWAGHPPGEDLPGD